MVLDCSDGDTRYALLTNALDLVGYILRECKSSAPFTQSITTFNVLCGDLLRDYRMINSSIHVRSALPRDI